MNRHKQRLGMKSHAHPPPSAFLPLRKPSTIFSKPTASSNPTLVPPTSSPSAPSPIIFLTLPSIYALRSSLLLSQSTLTPPCLRFSNFGLSSSTKVRSAGRFETANSEWSVSGLEKADRASLSVFKKARDGVDDVLISVESLVRVGENREVSANKIAAFCACVVRSAKLSCLVSCSLRRSSRIDSGVGAEGGRGSVRF